MTEKGGDFELARLAPELVPLLDFSDVLLLAERVIETVSGSIHAAAGRRRRQIEHTSAQSKDALIPFGRRAIGVTPGFAGIVERAGINERPVHEIGLGIVGIFVGIETSTMENLPTHRTRRFAVYDCENRLTSASTFCVSPPRSMVCRTK